MNFWEWIQYTAWDIQGRFGNKDAAAHADALWTVTHSSDKSDRQINDIVNSAKVEFDGMLGAVNSFGVAVKNMLSGAVKGVTGTFNTLGGILKNLPLILILAGLVLAAIYLPPILKKVK